MLATSPGTPGLCLSDSSISSTYLIAVSIDSNDQQFSASVRRACPKPLPLKTSHPLRVFNRVSIITYSSLTVAIPPSPIRAAKILKQATWISAGVGRYSPFARASAHSASISFARYSSAEPLFGS